MGASTKLQGQIDQVLKKVQEGVDIFDSIWNKIWLMIDRFALDDYFDDCDIGDEIDPEIKDQIDREVEDFARKLNSDWPERVQELLSLGQERRPILYTVNGMAAQQNVQALFDLKNANQDLKSDLKDLYINGVVQIDAAGN